MQKKRKILFVGEAVTLAHVVRPLTLARTLNPSKYEITFACDLRYKNIIGEIEFQHKNIYTILTDHFLKAIVHGKTGYDYPILKKYVEEDLKLINDVDPDIIVGDFRLSLMISSKLSSKTYINITNGYWSPYSRNDFFPIPEHPAAKLLGIKISEFFFNFFSNYFFSILNSPWNKLLKRYNLPIVGNDIRQVFGNGDFVAYADIPDLYSMDGLPESHRFIGPIPWAPKTAYPDWWEEIPETGQKVYVNLGSSGNKKIMPILCKVLSKLPVIGIFALAGGESPEVNASNLYFADYLPGDQVASVSDLVVCNGGSPSTYQALSEGVPVLGLPTNMDQCLNMKILVNTSLGLMERNWTISEKQLQTYIIRLLSERQYKENAIRLKNRIASFSVKKEFPNMVNQIK